MSTNVDLRKHLRLAVKENTCFFQSNNGISSKKVFNDKRAAHIFFISISSNLLFFSFIYLFAMLTLPGVNHAI